MTARALLNVAHTLVLSGAANADERESLRQQLTDPGAWRAEREQQVRKDLLTAGGEVA